VSLRITPASGGTIRLETTGLSEATLVLEASVDLNTWNETQRLTGQGNGTPVKVNLQADPNVQTKFWRVRVR